MSSLLPFLRVTEAVTGHAHLHVSDMRRYECL